MTGIFFYGTLRDPELRGIVLGADAALMDAVLPDHAVTWAGGQVFPTITLQAGAQAEGMLLEDPDTDLLARLDFYEGGFGYDLKPVRVTAQGAAQDARVYFPRPGLWRSGAPFVLADWQDRYGALSRLATSEAMEYLAI